MNPYSNKNKKSKKFMLYACSCNVFRASYFGEFRDGF